MDPKEAFGTYWSSWTHEDAPRAHADTARFELRGLSSAYMW